MIMNVMIEDEAGEDVDVAELNEWADTYGLTFPVVTDPGSSTMYRYASGSVGLPFTVLIDRGVVVESLDSPSSSDVADFMQQ